jgi:hypothetical protein
MRTLKPAYPRKDAYGCLTLLIILRSSPNACSSRPEPPDPEACVRARQIYSDYRVITNVALSQRFTLGRAQHVIAVEHGFANWEAVATSVPTEAHQAISERRGKAREFPAVTRNG